MRKILVLAFALTAATQCIPTAPAAGAEINHPAPHTMRGIVKDALGRPIQSALVRLETAGGHMVATTASDADGHFFFDRVGPGTYQLLVDKPAFKAAVATVAIKANATTRATVTMESSRSLNLAIVTTRLNRARERLDPRVGASDYHFSQAAIESLPQGTNTQFNQVLLQAPGVAQDSFGQLHIRGEHANIQYRIDGVQLPEGVDILGQTQSPRFARSIDLIRGALPAQYGFRTSGVIDIRTKTGAEEDGGYVEFYGGQRDTQQPSFELGGRKDNLSYFFTGQYMRNDRGIQPPTTGPSAIHDHTDQGNFFGYLSYLIGPSARLSLITGNTLQEYAVPAARNVRPRYTLAGVNEDFLDAYPSTAIGAEQIEQDYFDVLSLQGSAGAKLNYQLSAFAHYSTIKFNPDLAGDLIYTGVAGGIFRSNISAGLQGDASYELTKSHTVRFGYYFSGQRAEIDNHSWVFPADDAGMQTSTTPFLVVDDNAITAWLYDGYLQDEWRPAEKWTINFGARYDIADTLRRSNQLCPRFGLVYKPWKQTTVHAGYALYFTPVPIQVVNSRSLEKFVNTTNAPLSLLNTTPKPERANYFDVGVIQQLLPGLTAGVDSYFKYSRDLLDEGQFGSAFIYTPFNYVRGRQWGIEFSASYARRNLMVYLNTAVSRAQGTRAESSQFTFTPNELAYIGSHWINLDHDQTVTGSGGINYRWRKFLFTFDGLQASGLRSGFANLGNLPTYFQFNMGVVRTLSVFKQDDVEARFDIINMFDHMYQIRNGTGIGVTAAQHGPRLTFYGGLKWNFSWGRHI